MISCWASNWFFHEAACQGAGTRKLSLFVSRRSPMAVINLRSLVLRGMCIVGGNTTDEVRMGSSAAKRQAPVSLSYPRHQSQRFPRTSPFSDTRAFSVDRFDGDAGERTVRSGSHAGDLVSRYPARIAGRTIPWGRSVVKGGSRPAAAWCLALKDAKPTAPAGLNFPGRLEPLTGSTPKPPTISTRGESVLGQGSVSTSRIERPSS